MQPLGDQPDGSASMDTWTYQTGSWLHSIADYAYGDNLNFIFSSRRIANENKKR